MNDNGAMPTRYRGVVDNYVVVGETPDAVESNLKGDLPAMIEEPTDTIGWSSWIRTWYICVIAAIGLELADVACEGMRSKRALDALTCTAEIIPPRRGFQVHAL